MYERLNRDEAGGFLVRAKRAGGGGGGRKKKKAEGEDGAGEEGSEEGEGALCIGFSLAAEFRLGVLAAVHRHLG